MESPLKNIEVIFNMLIDSITFLKTLFFFIVYNDNL